MYYFAYGSNMSEDRLGSRIHVLNCLGKARLPGYDLRCDKIGQHDGSGKFTVIESHLDNVWGVLFELSDAALDKLDKIEGPGYQRLRVQVNAPEAGIVTALAYQARPGMRDDALKPFDWYLELAVAGARKHGLPEHYIHRLERWPSHVDPDTERNTVKRAILDPTAL